MSNFLIDDETNLLAAEFVLGTLDPEERANAHSLLRFDHRFIAMVKIWERRLGELHLMVEPVEPGPEVLARIKAKLAELPPGEGPASRTTLDAATVGPKAAEPTEPAEPAEPAEAANLAESSAETTPAEGEPPEGPVRPDDVADASQSGAVEASPPSATPSEPAVAEAEPVAELRESETVTRLERGASEPRVEEAPPVPPPASEAPPRLPGTLADVRDDRRPQLAIDMIRSRRRWRAFSLLLVVLVAALGGLVAAWRFAPERVPAALQPGQVMTAIGIGSSAPQPQPRPDRPASGAFDE
jgi:hypothetical protein